jgi:hypothetical protein
LAFVPSAGISSDINSSGVIDLNIAYVALKESSDIDDIISKLESASKRTGAGIEIILQKILLRLPEMKNRKYHDAFLEDIVIGGQDVL